MISHHNRSFAALAVEANLEMLNNCEAIIVTEFATRTRSTQGVLRVTPLSNGKLVIDFLTDVDQKVVNIVSVDGTPNDIIDYLFIK